MSFQFLCFVTTIANYHQSFGHLCELSCRTVALTEHMLCGVSIRYFLSEFVIFSDRQLKTHMWWLFYRLISVCLDAMDLNLTTFKPKQNKLLKNKGWVLILDIWFLNATDTFWLDSKLYKDSVLHKSVTPGSSEKLLNNIKAFMLGNKIYRKYSYRTGVSHLGLPLHPGVYQWAARTLCPLWRWHCCPLPQSGDTTMYPV